MIFLHYFVNETNFSFFNRKPVEDMKNYMYTREINIRILWQIHQRFSINIIIKISEKHKRNR